MPRCFSSASRSGSAGGSIRIFDFRLDDDQSEGYQLVFVIDFVDLIDHRAGHV